MGAVVETLFKLKKEREASEGTRTQAEANL